MTAAGACTTGTTDQGIITLQNGRGTIRNCQIPNTLSADLVLTGRRSDGIMYSINGRVDVGSDVRLSGTARTLTVNPGVTVFGRTTSSALIVNRGSKLIANGQAALPIIFTSLSNLDSTVNQAAVNQWGGIIVNGQAPVSECDVSVSPGGAATAGGTSNCWRKAEGVTLDTLFGGDQSGDDSGIFRYVQVNFTGQGQNGNEIQGITTGGVGSATVFENLQVHNSSDDGIEFFGGSNNMKRVVLTGNADDSLDTDVGYQGAIQFVLAIRRNDNYPGDSAGARTLLEVDSGGNGNSSPRQYLKLANFTFIQTTPGEPAIRVRGGTDADLINGIVIANASGNTVGCFDVDDAETVQAAGTYGTANTPDRGPVRLLSVAFQCNGGLVNDGDGFDTQVINNPANSNVDQNFANSLLFLNPPTDVGYRFANGPKEAAVDEAANLTSISAFLAQVTYIGAFNGPNDDWTAGWTCNSDLADLKGATNCTDIRIS